MDENETASDTGESLSGYNPFTFKRPKHIVSGVVSGIQNIITGFAVALFSALYLPIQGAIDGFSSATSATPNATAQETTTSAPSTLSKVKGTTVGLLKGVVFSLPFVLLLPAAGVVAGSYQIVRGILNTPESIGEQYLEDKEWDSEKREWYMYSLKAEEEAVLSETEEEHLAKLQSQKDKKKQQEERPDVLVKDQELYNTIGVPTNATTAEIKKAYYLKARKLHPDKNPNDPAANARFQALSSAYQILSDPAARSNYDKNGKQGIENPNTKIDSVMVFNLLFGSEKFEPIVGEMYMSMQLGLGLDGLSEDSGVEEMAQVFNQPSEIMEYKQHRREVQTAVNLALKLEEYIAAESNQEQLDRLFQKWTNEAKELAQDSLGSILLGLIGYIYIEQAVIYMGFKHSVSAGVGMKSLKKKAHQAKISSHHYFTITKVVGSILKTYTKSVWKGYFDKDKKNKADTAEQESKENEDSSLATSLDDNEEKEFMNKIQNLGIEYVWNSCVIDIETTLRRVIRKLFKDLSVSPQVRMQRAKGLEFLGQIYKHNGEYFTSPKVGLKLVKEKFKDHLQQEEREFDPNQLNSQHAQETEAETASEERTKPKYTVYSINELNEMKPKALKKILEKRKVNTYDCLEKADYIAKIIESQQ